MAQRRNKDLLSRLADRGEQVVGRITDMPGAKQLLDRTAALTKGLDDVQKRLRSLDPLERRVTQIERRLDKLEGKGTTRRATGSRRTGTAKRSTTASSGAKRSTSTRRTPTRRTPRRRGPSS